MQGTICQGAALRILPPVTPTAEQLSVLLEGRPGVFVVNGAAGSGKTTTALLRLKKLCAEWLSRKRRLNLTAPVRVLVLTYNKTLEGYISELAHAQVAATPSLANAVAAGELVLEVRTFAKWSVDLLGEGSAPDANACQAIAERLASGLGMSERFVTDELEYILGRFSSGNLESYLSTSRDGRGASPRMELPSRQRFLDAVVRPYIDAKRSANLRDWNDVTAEAGSVANAEWDIVIVDEAQDFSANQVRTLMGHVSGLHSVTFVTDAAQRIYPRSFTWKEAGVSLAASRRLETNYRNTKQIAAFARSVLAGMVVGDDGTLPNLDSAAAVGDQPIVLVGTYASQVTWALEQVVSQAVLKDESVAFLHPLGGGWFDYLKMRLTKDDIPWVQMSRASVWPGGEESVALSTIHSAKGLEFDHVVILGLNQQVTPHGDGAEDSLLESLRRLLAMGIGRAKKSVTLGFKENDASTLIGLLDSATYDRIEV